MAKFRFKYGTMKSGKTQELLRTAYNYNLKNEKVLILTSGHDTRNGVGKVTSRTGESLDAYPITTVEDLLRLYTDEELPVCVLIDEVQFFEPTLIKAIKSFYVSQKNIPVIAYGLRSNYLGKLFDGSSECFALAEEVDEIETVCSRCNKKATMNSLISLSESDLNGTTSGGFLIGDGNYEPTCYDHWLEILSEG